MPLLQNDMGRAFEYGVAVALHEKLSAEIEELQPFEVTRNCFQRCSGNEQSKIIRSTEKAIDFIVSHDKRLSQGPFIIRIQTDRHGQEGDVRDILVVNLDNGDEIGISAKNRHHAVKHSRLSEHINFGQEWFSLSCTDLYFETITPLFHELRSLHVRQEKWRDIPNKKLRFYTPLLDAFQSEILRLNETNPELVAQGIVSYLLGRFDYYKVIKENGNISITSFNMHGTLGWGYRLPLPSRIVDIALKEGTETTLMMIFDRGWQISFRIHNASTIVEPSLKFDIAPVGFPSQISTNQISYM